MAFYTAVPGFFKYMTLYMKGLSIHKCTRSQSKTTYQPLKCDSKRGKDREHWVSYRGEALEFPPLQKFDFIITSTATIGYITQWPSTA